MKQRMRHATAQPQLIPARPSEGPPPAYRLVRARPSGPPLPGRADSPLRLAFRGAAASVFVALGYLKLVDSIPLGTAQVFLPKGPEGFALYLDAIGVPFPLFNAWMVIAVELLCGLGLLLSAFLPASRLLTRLCALPLAGDMTVATATVGLPNLLGRPVLLDGVAVTAQAWRLPLEVGLLLITLYLLWRPVAARLHRA